MTDALRCCVRSQMITKEILREELVPLLSTSAGPSRITAQIPALALDQILRAEQQQSRPLAVVVAPEPTTDAAGDEPSDFDEVRTSIAPARRAPETLVATATMRTIPDAPVRGKTRLVVIAISFAATLGVGIGVLVFA